VGFDPDFLQDSFLAVDISVELISSVPKAFVPLLVPVDIEMKIGLYFCLLELITDEVKEVALFCFDLFASYVHGYLTGLFVCCYYRIIR
jgi:hypothetical protein